MSQLKVGGTVIFVDAVGVKHDAIITAIWGKVEDRPCINVVFASGDDTKQDSYGRQIERATSVVYRTDQRAHGYYYMFEGEPMNVRAPLQA